MPKELSSPIQVNEFPKKAHAVVTPNSVEEERIDECKFLQSNHRSIPDHVKFMACTWIYKRSHDFCKYTPVEEIPKMLCKFEVECTKDGREFRIPILKKIDGNDTPVYESMEFQSNCRVHWRCELCSLPMCIDPRAYVEKEVVPCAPVQSKDLARVHPFWSNADYIFYYLMLDHVDLEMDDIDIKSLKNHFRNYDFGGKAETMFWNEVHSYSNSQEIVHILKQKLDLTE